MSVQRETSVLELVINGKQAETSINGLTNSIRGAEREFKKMRQADNPAAYAEAAKNIRLQRNALSEMRKELQGVTKEAMNWKEVAKGVFTGNMFQQGLGMLKDFAVSAVSTYANFQKMGSVLANALGSKSEANKALKDLSRFAAETPFQLEELTSSYLKLVNRGMQPTMTQMKMMGDLATSQGKSFDQLTEALLDATTGEFERLKEFGIRASKNGDMVALSFKGITQEVKFTSGAIQGAIEGFAQMPGVAGAMQSMGKDLTQVFSNFGDNVDMLGVKFGSATGGFIYSVVSGFSSIISKMAETRTNSQILTDELVKSDRGYKTLETGVNNLTKRYDELKGKTKLSADEQEELKQVVNDLASIVPSAATAFDKYGNALDVNKEKLTAFLDVQKAMLQFQYKEAIPAVEKEIKREKLRQSDLQKQLDTAMKTGKMRKDGGVVFVTDEDLARTRQLLSETTAGVGLLENQLKGMKGEDLSMLDTSDEKIKKQQELQRLKDEADATAKENAKQADKDAKDAEREAKAATKKALSDFTGLNKEYAKLGVDRLNDQLSKNEKEVIQEQQKYDALISKEKDFLTQKGVTASQRTAIEEQISKLEVEKGEAVKNLRIKQEQEMLIKITELRTSLANLHESELQKQRDRINKFYDGLERENAGNEKAITELKKERAKELTDAKLREEERLEEEKRRLSAEYLVITSSEEDKRLAEIERRYELEVKALKDKFSQELQATKEFQDALDQLTKNKEAEKEKDAQKKKEQELEEEGRRKIDAYRAISNATFSILSDSLNHETSAKISAIEKERERELSVKNLSESQKKKINDKFDRQAAQEKEKAWKAQKAADIAQAVINGALAMTKVTAQTGVLSFAFSPGIALATAAQIAVIAAQKPPKFKDGGVPDGPSHAQGGIKMVDGITGSVIGEMEGGEPIISKEKYAANKQTIDEIMFGNARSKTYNIASTDLVNSAERFYRNGGIAPGVSKTSGSEYSKNTTSTESSRLDRLEQSLDKLIGVVNAESTKQVIFSQRTFEEESARRIQIKNDAGS